MFNVSLSLFKHALNYISVSTAYAVWSALGTAVITTMGVLFFNEKFTLSKALALASIVGGVVVLERLE